MPRRYFHCASLLSTAEEKLEDAEDVALIKEEEATCTEGSKPPGDSAIDGDDDSEDGGKHSLKKQ
jgi:hypothetical protein